MKNLILSIAVVLVSTVGFANEKENVKTDGEVVVDVLNNKLEVLVSGKLVSVNKEYGQKMRVFEASTGDIVLIKTTNEIDFTQLNDGSYTIEVEGYAPTTVNIK